MTVAVSNVANVSAIPEQYKQEDHEGIYLHDADGNERITGFYRKGSTVNRGVTGAAGNYSGSGKATRLYTVRVIAYAQKSIPKAPFFIASIEPFAAKAAAAPCAKWP